ncbi:MAG: hypothetical protein M1617_08275 [Actinobacteria bacterium]|nr:hypothetical protein [Actinomycetota bacterium]MCL5888262.1 hypothetical protein [Actinomycetota bacterium]
MSERQSVRPGHSSLIVEPPVTEWPTIAAENSRLLADGECVVAGQPLDRLRALARREALDLARAFTARAGLPSVAAHHENPEGPLVVTGHQPILCSTGVWSKYFALSHFAKRTGGTGIDLVIDSDRAGPIAVDVPSLGGRPSIESVVLSPGNPNGYFAAVPTPAHVQVESFGAEVLSALGELPHSEARLNFEAFLSALMIALPLAENLAELMSFTRRHFETSAGLNYLQLPVTALSETLSFRSFAADILTRADEFAAVYNQELAVFRGTHKVRSAAQPVPDLRRDENGVELPFWLLVGGVRQRTFVRRSGGAIELFTQEEGGAHVMPIATDVLKLQLEHVKLVPKALIITMYTRLLLADMFIHGTGGARYDSVTNAIIRRFYGVDSPHFAVTSVPAPSPFVCGEPELEQKISAAEDRLKTLTRRPERALSAMLLDPDHVPGTAALELVSQKLRMVSEIAKPGADKALLGERIRHINELLRASLQDEVTAVEDQLAGLRARATKAAILSDRRYPYCFFDPREYSRMFDRAVL